MAIARSDARSGLCSMRMSIDAGAAPAAIAASRALAVSARIASGVGAWAASSRSARTSDSASPIEEITSALSGTMHSRPSISAT